MPKQTFDENSAHFLLKKNKYKTNQYNTHGKVAILIDGNFLV